MKSILTSLSLTFIFCLNLSAQFFESDFAANNPAMSGLVDRHYGIAKYEEDFFDNSIFNAAYHTDLAKMKSGVGFNFQNVNQNFNKSNQLSGNYRYSLSLTDSINLSIGTTMSFRSARFDSLYFDGQVGAFTEPLNTFSLGLGAVLEWRGLSAGISANNLNRPKYFPGAKRSSLNWSMHAWYDSHVTENFKLSPSWITVFNENYESHSLSLRFEHFNRFWYALGVNVNKVLIDYGYSVQYVGGVGIRVVDQFHLTIQSGFVLFRDNSGIKDLGVGLVYRLQK